MKQYHQGVIVGRFQPLHLGHVKIVKEALRHCDRVLVLIGSSQASNTSHNPFDYQTRAEMFRLVFGDQVQVAPLPDIGVGNVGAWGEYVIAKAEEAVGHVDCFIQGREEKNNRWFASMPELPILEVERSELPISSSLIRTYLSQGDEASFRKAMPEALWSQYENYRSIVSSLPLNEATDY